MTAQAETRPGKAAVRLAAAAATVMFAGAATAILVNRVESASHLMGHITIERPAELTGEEALDVYQALSTVMADGYARARMPLVRGYQSWQRYNSAPYRSATHGRRFVNNYANHLAGGYERIDQGVRMAPGAVLAKDSFTVTDEGRALPAPLFVMEKLAEGASPETGDWRYLEILPDGSVFGDSQGAGRERVAFCHDCHAGVADADYLFFVPDAYRADN